MAKRKKDQAGQNSRKLVTWFNSKSPVAEQYRTIRTNLQYASVDNNVQTIAITSAGPGEGKSTTVANLAVTMAQQGKKTILVDADLRKPTVHYTFRRTNTNGLINVLANKEPFHTFTQKTEVPDLDILPSGPIPPNPAEILGTTAMENLVNDLKKEYDIILFDAPPVLAVTDVQVISKYCDGTILVIKSGDTEKDSAIKAKELLEVTGIPVLGCILNQVKGMDQRYYYYYGES
ncbi:CpsD/CapB family tyrosine-protein kinase [Sinobaca sp. H24]|uniref:CpsD/CapB family tyrosine-protein kinase n=1 Tax=Sinobaca sp. H24 TaxID=2923376 RepID=UPI00207984E9|nr:CpsD/CapB family tyrosine-protein kinase [Sinobaca sp. H24]